MHTIHSCYVYHLAEILCDSLRVKGNRININKKKMTSFYCAAFSFLFYLDTYFSKFVFSQVSTRVT